MALQVRTSEHEQYLILETRARGNTLTSGG